MRRFLVPEAIQTSAMDCGPASLKSLLEGFGVSASYGRLREACQTGVDGTSIDTMEEAAVQLGLDAVQVMLPLDHLLDRAADALPGIVVVRQPNGSTHFVVAWRRHGPLVQVMDPGVGRRWMGIGRFLEDVYEHRMPIDAAAWREWAGSDSFMDVLRARMKRLGAVDARLIADALADSGAAKLARLDAAVRMTQRLADSGAVRRGGESARMVDVLARGAMPIPAEYWSARPIDEQPDQVMLRGAVVLQVKGRKERADAKLSPELAAALTEKPARPALELLRILAGDGVLPLLMIAGALALSAFGSVVEALLLRGLYDLARELTSTGQRAAAIGAALGFLAALVLLEFVIAMSVLRTGRRLELRLRLRFLYKIPRLADRYFRSRPSSDMAERSHNVHQLRQAAELSGGFLRSAFEMALTVAAIGWLYPSAFWPSLLVAVAAVGVPLMAQPMLAERDLKFRSHAGALMRFNLDALLGVTAIRAHGAARAVRREQSVLLGEWARSGFALQRTATLVEGFQMSVSLALAGWVVWAGLTGASDVAGALLLVYWVLNLPTLGLDAAAAAWQYPMLRNTALRFIEPLGAPEEPVVESRAHREGAASIRLEEVTVVAGGHRILDNVSLDIPAASHIAIVGRSGAGKSSLVGVLLGWHRPSAGRVEVDGREFDAAALDQLRSATAWVDPQIQIWNSSLFENLTYGNPGRAVLDDVIEDASLGGVIAKLPEGMQTALGEGGGLVSGGEGQRVRLGRAMARDWVRLAILDEPARGLDRTHRRIMIERARERWKDATLLCITHDVCDTLDFERVLVIEDGRVIEDGAPAALRADSGTRYAQLLEAETQVQRGLWSSDIWRRFRIEHGEMRAAPVSRTSLRAGRQPGEPC
ncbi:MAG: ATP-binding cassette domain-containing protein [Acidobacteria bacterium]|nr:ATP-binding cassette domain-containing protein [Acidobacteriota bacterium]